LARRADWVRHENVLHRRIEWWECSIGDCQRRCEERSHFEQHLVLEHKLASPAAAWSPESAKTRGDTEAESTSRKVAECRKESEKRPHLEPCCFCGEVFGSRKRLSVHLSRHFEQISLAVLPLVVSKASTSEPWFSPAPSDTWTVNTGTGSLSATVSASTVGSLGSMSRISSAPTSITTGLPTQSTGANKSVPAAQALSLPSIQKNVSSAEAPVTATLAPPNPAATVATNTVTRLTTQPENDPNDASISSDLGLSHRTVKSAGDALPVRRISIECFESFERLLDASAEELSGDVCQTILPCLRDELGRLRVWAAEGGALQTGHGSLDHKLRDVSEVAQQLVRALSELKEVLQEGLHSTIPLLLSSCMVGG
jgi:hypothetical protein